MVTVELPSSSTIGTPGRAPEGTAGDGVTLPDTLRRAGVLLNEFLALMAEVPYDNQGIPMSEMFFLLCALGDSPPRRILESGRGGGQSTHVLGQRFRQSAVISVEENVGAANARAALTRLTPLPNVDCRFGDSRQLLPELLREDDAVLIDGPKEFRALKLAFQLLLTGKPRVVFIHDLHARSPARRFLDLHLPGAFYSDEPGFVESYSYLDKMNGAQPKAHWLKSGRRGYGPTLACVPGGLASRVDYAWLLRQLQFARMVSHARDKLKSFAKGWMIGKHAPEPAG